MIRVMLLNAMGERSYVAYDRVPVPSDDRKCRPEETTPVGATLQITKELAQGHVSGWVGGYRWFRQAG
jgi:hypothetical protein